MDRLFLGLLFVFLNFNINIGNSTIGLLPDFVGYILILKGLKEMQGASRYFEKAEPWAMVLAVYTGVLYGMDLFALSVRMRLLGWCLGLLALMASLIVSYWIVCGVQEMEMIRFWDLQGQKLKSMWTYMAILDGICYVCGWIPVVGTMGAIAAFIMGICFLVAFYKSKTLYFEYNS